MMLNVMPELSCVSVCVSMCVCLAEGYVCEFQPHLHLSGLAYHNALVVLQYAFS